MPKEWQIRCDDCNLRSFLNRRPVVGGFHWSNQPPYGKCKAIPEVYVREVSKWERVPPPAEPEPPAEDAK